MQHPAFQRVWLMSMLAYLVRFTDFTVVAWLVTERTDSSSAVGLLIFFRFVPFLVFGPFVGLIADRYPRIRIMRLTQVGLATSTLGLALALLFGDVTLWHIYLYTLINGVLFMFEISAKRPYMSAVVGPKHITAALALDMISLNTAWFIGSNLGGVIVANVSAGYLYLGIAAVFLLNFVILRGLPVLFRRETDGTREPAYKSLRSGLTYARQNRLILGGLLAVGINNFSGYTFESMSAVFAKDIYHAGPLLFGLIMSAQGLGSLLTAFLLVAYGKRFKRPGLLVLVAAMVQHIGSIALSFAGVPALGILALLMLGTVSMMFGIMHNTLVLTATPDRVRGRIVGLQILAMGMYPIGSLAVGALSDAIGLQMAVRVFASGGLLVLVLLALAFPELRRKPERPGYTPERSQQAVAAEPGPA